MAASGTGTLVFINDVTQDRSSRMNSEVFRDILSAQIQLNAVKLIGQRFIIQMDDYPKHAAKATKWNILEWPSQSPDLNPIENAFCLLKTKLRTERPPNKQTATESSCNKGLAEQETKHLVMSMSSRLQAVIASKEFSTKY